MRRWADCYAPLIGRILVGGFFLWSGILNALNFDEVTASLAAAHVPYPNCAILLIIVIEAVGGVALVVGRKMKIAALLLAVYVILKTLFLHTTNFNDPIQTTLFLENLALVGGLLYMSA